jgi:hypothetical protein
MIPTPVGLRQQARRLDPQQRKIEQFVARLCERGCSMICYHQLGRPTFTLSDGTRMSEEIGRALTKHPNIVSVDLPLFRDGFSQIYRYTSEPRITDYECRGEQTKTRDCAIRAA